MFQGEHSAILLTFNKLPFVIKIFVLSILEWPLYMGFTVRKIDFQYQLHVSLNTGQKCCRMLQGEHSATILTFIKLPFVKKNFVVSIFEWQFYTGFTVQ